MDNIGVNENIIAGLSILCEEFDGVRGNSHTSSKILMRFEGISLNLKGPGQARTGISELSRQALCPFELRGPRFY